MKTDAQGFRSTPVIKPLHDTLERTQVFSWVPYGLTVILGRGGFAIQFLLLQLVSMLQAKFDGIMVEFSLNTYPGFATFQKILLENYSSCNLATIYANF